MCDRAFYRALGGTRDATDEASFAFGWSQLSGAYLVARAADTIADTRVVRGERRLELLGELRQAILSPARNSPGWIGQRD